jgi:hypothetical protein
VIKQLRQVLRGSYDVFFGIDNPLMCDNSLDKLLIILRVSFLFFIFEDFPSNN